MYTKLQFNSDLEKKLSFLIARGQFKINAGGRLEGVSPQGSKGTPWIFINYGHRKKYCGLWNSIFCQTFNLIPTHCRVNCWKTVIKPRNVLELFECYNIMQTLDLPSKIGMDIRDYTYGAWSGYVYADSLAEGRKYHKMLKDAVKPKRVPIILKCGCTEMERIRPSTTWNVLEKSDLELEQRLNDIFQFSEIDFFQGAWLKHEIKERWIKRAIEIGDPTAREAAEKYSEDPDIWNKLVVNSVTYHDKKE